MEVNEGNVKILAYIVAGSAGFGASIISVIVLVIKFIKPITKLILKLFNKKHNIEEEQNNVTSLREKELERELSEKDKIIQGQDKIIQGHTIDRKIADEITEVLSKKLEEFSTNWKLMFNTKINELKESIDVKYTPKETTGLIIKILDKKNAEEANYKKRTYFVIKTMERALIANGFKINYDEEGNPYNNLSDFEEEENMLILRKFLKELE